MLALTPANKFQLLFFAARLKHPQCSAVTALLPLAMAQLEAKADFSSPLAVNAHNIFGMQYPAGRAAAGLTSATGKTASGFAIYDSLWGSIDDFFYFLENWKLFSDAALDDFVKAKKYTADAGYYDTVHKIAAQLKPQLLNVPALVAETALAGAGLGLAVHIANKALKK